MRPWSHLWVAVLLTEGCVKPVSPALTAQPQAFFRCPAAEVFKAAIRAIEVDELWPLEVRDDARMFLSTKEIRETSLGGPIKSRLSATVRADEGGANLRIYRDLHRLSAGRWIAIPSDLSLEQKLIGKIRSASSCDP